MTRHRFTDDDERGYVLLPIGKYAGKVEDISLADQADKHGDPYYKMMLVVLSGDYAGVPVSTQLSAYWMKHLLIHLMRAVGMMDTMVVDPMFREMLTDSQSFDMARIVANLPGCLVGFEIEHRAGQKDNKTYHNIKDFFPLRKKDGSGVAQPAWKDLGPVPGGPSPDDVELDPDIDLTEDEDFFVD